MKLIIFLCLVAALGVNSYEFPPNSIATSQMRQTLLNDLFRDYDTDNYPTIVNVQTQFSPVAFDVDVASHSLIYDIVFGFTWYDYRLVWDPTKYGGISSFVVRSSKIWVPDVSAVPSPKPVFSDGQCDPSGVVIHSTGEVQWAPQCHHSVYCNSTDSLSAYPNGPITCPVVIGSWIYSSVISFSFFGGSAQSAFDMTSNWAYLNEWVLTGVSGRMENVFYNCCPAASYNGLIINLTVQRGSSSCS